MCHCERASGKAPGSARRKDLAPNGAPSAAESGAQLPRTAQPGDHRVEIAGENIAGIGIFKPMADRSKDGAGALLARCVQRAQRLHQLLVLHLDKVPEGHIADAEVEDPRDKALKRPD